MNATLFPDIIVMQSLLHTFNVGYIVTTIFKKYLVQQQCSGKAPLPYYNLPLQQRILCTYKDFAQLVLNKKSAWCQKQKIRKICKNF